MKKSPIYRRNQIGGSLFEDAQTLEALSKQGFVISQTDCYSFDCDDI